MSEVVLQSRLFIREKHSRYVKPKRAQPEPKDGVLDGLAPKERAFVIAYLDLNGNATRAGMKAGLGTTYGSCAVKAASLLKSNKIRKVLQEIFEQSGMGSEEVVARLAQQARANPTDFFDKKWRLKRKELDTNGHLIRKLRPPSRGRPAEIELHDAQAALIKLGQNVGLFSEKIQHVGDQGGPIRHEFTVHVVGGPENGGVRPTGPKAALPAPAIDVEAAPEGGAA